MEWADIISKLEEAVRRCLTLPEPNDTDPTQLTDWIVWSTEMLHVATDSIDCLAKTKRAFDRFQKGDMGYSTSDMYIGGFAKNIIKSHDDLGEILAHLETLKTTLTEAMGPAVSSPAIPTISNLVKVAYLMVS